MYGSGGVMNGVSCGEVSHERIGNLAGPVDVLIGEVGEGLVLGVVPPLICEPTDGCLQLLCANTTAGYTSLIPLHTQNLANFPRETELYVHL